MPTNLENSAVAVGLEKVSFNFISQTREMPKNIQATIQSHSFFMLVRLCSVSFRLALSMWTKKFLSWKQVLGKVEETEMTSICWIIEKAREFQKNIYFCFIAYSKACDCES